MKIPKSWELLLLQDFMEYLMIWEVPKLYLIGKRFSEKDLKIGFNSLFTFFVEKKFWSKKDFGKDLHG